MTFDLYIELNTLLIYTDLYIEQSDIFAQFLC